MLDDNRRINENICHIPEWMQIITPKTASAVLWRLADLLKSHQLDPTRLVSIEYVHMLPLIHLADKVELDQITWIPRADNLNESNNRYSKKQTRRTSKSTYCINLKFADCDIEHNCERERIDWLVSRLMSKTSVKFTITQYNITFYSIPAILYRLPSAASPSIIMEQQYVQSVVNLINKINSQAIVDIPLPILDSELMSSIYENSIAFLLNVRSHLDDYQHHFIIPRRGILLAGDPGNGKTSCCKWIRQKCKEHNFDFKTITLANFDDAYRRGTVSALFSGSPNIPTIIFFDDMDIMVKNRRNFDSRQLGTFLSELDGMNSPTSGVVYIFTTNYLHELDPAFVRPGRIDYVAILNAPHYNLRREFFLTRLAAEIVNSINIDNLVATTEGFSFAKLEEIRKQMCFAFIENHNIDTAQILNSFLKTQDEFIATTELGFGAMKDNHNE